MDMPERAADRARTTFLTLQAGRAIAAVAVVVFHAHTFFLPARLYPNVTISPLFNMGYAGVEFFFVLSGFIMVLAHRRDLDRPGRAGVFLRKRIFRIYPLYWIILTALIVASLALPGAGPESLRDTGRLAMSYLLIRNTEAFPVHAAWTLSHEMLFYLVFAVLIVDLRIGRLLFLLWMGGIAVTTAFAEPIYPFWFIFSYINLLFPIGMLAAAGFARLPARRSRAIALAGIAAFLLIGVLDVYGLWPGGPATRTLSYGVAAGVAIAGFAQAETVGAISVPRALLMLGDASYSIYLIHGPVLGFVSLIALRLGLNHLIPAWLMLVAMVVAGVVAGIVTHFAIEKPILAFLNRRFAKPSAPPATVPG